MNAAAREYVQGNLFEGSVTTFKITREQLRVLVLGVCLLFSALSVVYVKNYERSLFSQLQHSRQSRQHLQIQWRQLLLEQGTWGTPARVQEIAETRFGMSQPNPQQVVLVRL